MLSAFAPATRAWFAASFAEATRVQREAWRQIAAGEHVLLSAPTGSGKTLAAFLWCIDRLTQLPARAPGGVRVLYISPLKALAHDVERNLALPLAGIQAEAARLDTPLRPVRVSLRTGDTSQRDRQALRKDPGDILITTPESLYLMLGSGAREVLRSVDTVIVDEIHVLAPSKRGAHLALSLERLCELTGREPQRIGLSATQRPLSAVARYLGGRRPVSIIDAGEAPRVDLTIEVPADDMEAPPPPTGPPEAGGAPLGFAQWGGAQPRGVTPEERGMWPAIQARVLELVLAHQSTIVFTNSRRLCERLAQRLNELAQAPLVRAHHGSLARAQREQIEGALKRGELRGIVATSSLELGIDMGAVDLVVQIESPGGVARGLQRVGRAGHAVGRRSEGRIFPKFRGDLLEAAVVARGMLDGDVEPIRVPDSPLDVLAQQLVATCAEAEWKVDTLEAMVRRAGPYLELPRALLLGVLDMLAGRYPSDELADLRPRLSWDRARDVVVGRRDARLIALVNGGTIPDRGLFGVYLGHDGPRVGELDEEMVYETRPGQTFLLGASSWRIVEITRDRVIVKPAPGEPGMMPFWRGESVGRPIELGRAMGAFVRELGALDEADAVDWLGREYKLEVRAARNLWRYVDDQRKATGTLPTDRAITVERFRDELGDYRVCILSPLGARVHAPWALALEARLGARTGFEVQAIWSDDGIVLRFADAGGAGGDAGDAPVQLPDLMLAPEEVEELLLEQLGRSAMFAARFRENAARALLLPRRRPGGRTPLWTQRLRAQQLLAVAQKHADFPIVLETYRECLNDVFDVPALRELCAAVARREVVVTQVDTRTASPFARSLAFAYVAAFMYEGDAPLAERKAQALTLDRDLLRELLGQEELGALLEPAVLADVEAELQGLAESRRARDADGVADLLRRVGDLALEEVVARAEVGEGSAETSTETSTGTGTGTGRATVARWLEELVRSGRAVEVVIAGQPRWVLVEDVARYRDALGVVVPAGLPAALLAPVPAALESLLARWARAHGPFSTAAPANRYGLTSGAVEPLLRALAGAGRLVEGDFGTGASQWCDAEVLRQLRRRTLAHLRSQVAPVSAQAFARFLPRWHGIASPRGGLPRLREIVEQLEGLPLSFAELERELLPARMADYQPRMLDELGALGEIVWIGRGALGKGDGLVALYRRSQAHLLAATPLPAEAAPSALATALLADLEARGASFYMELCARAGVSGTEVLPALWELVWAGLCSNDTFQPLRSLGIGSRPPTRRRMRASGPILSQTAGRWSAVSALTARGGAGFGAGAAAGPAPVAETERAHARVLTLLERHGVVTREAAQAEAVPGGFSALAPVLRAMEEAGQLRRGYFVEGLGGSQYARAGTIERLRSARDDDSPAGNAVVLSAIDPANPYGALLPWPLGASDDSATPRRVAGARVVLVAGAPVLHLERGGSVRYFPDAAPGALEVAIAALRSEATRRRGRTRSLRVTSINGAPATRSEHTASFQRAGLRLEPGALTLPLAD